MNIQSFINQHRLRLQKGRAIEGIPCWHGLCDKQAKRIEVPETYTEIPEWRDIDRRVWVDLANRGMIYAVDGEIYVEIADNEAAFRSLMQRTREFFRTFDKKTVEQKDLTPAAI